MVLPRITRLNQTPHFWILGVTSVVALIINSIISSSIGYDYIQMGKVNEKIRLAFVGNSIQFVNDCPKLLENMMKYNQRYKTVTQDACLQGGATLISLIEGSSTCMSAFVSESSSSIHQEELKDDDDSTKDNKLSLTEKLLKREKWDYVIMNDQTQFPARQESRDKTVKILKKRYLPLIDESTTTTTVIFLMTAAYKTTITGPINNSEDLGTFDQFTESLQEGYQEYRNIFENSRIAPLGIAYQYIKMNYNIKLWEKLYATDNYHPSPHGTYLEACVLYCTIVEEMPPPLFDKTWWNDARYPVSDMPFPTEKEAKILREVACRVSNVPVKK